MRRALAAVALCLVLVLAGCSLPGGSSPGGSSPTAPTGVELTAENAPPGVSAESGTIENPDALLAAHNASLVESGFVAEVRTNATILRNGEPRQVRRTQVVRAESGLTEYNNTVLNPASRFDVWGNDSVQAVRLRTRGGVQYGTDRPQSATTLTSTTLLSRYLATGDWSVTNATMQDGEPVFTFRSSTVPSEANALPERATNLREYSAVLVVDSDGRISYFAATGTYTLDGTESSFAISHRVVSEGPEVDRPSWVDEAL
jgi:hypothetical protein